MKNNVLGLFLALVVGFVNHLPCGAQGLVNAIGDKIIWSLDQSITNTTVTDASGRPHFVSGNNLMFNYLFPMTYSYKANVVPVGGDLALYASFTASINGTLVPSMNFYPPPILFGSGGNTIKIKIWQDLVPDTSPYQDEQFISINNVAINGIAQNVGLTANLTKSDELTFGVSGEITSYGFDENFYANGWDYLPRVQMEVIESIPEPSTWALGIVGTVGFLLFFRSRKRRVTA